MYCKNCGKQISNDSKYCSYCGKEQSIKNNYESDEKESKGCFIPIILTLAVLTLVIMAIIAISYMKPIDLNDLYNQITSEREAKTTDITIDFKHNYKISTADTYTVIIQANEKIKDLILEIDYYNAKGEKINTYELYAGNLTPGNKYTYEIHQGGMKISDLDTVDNFISRVIGGYIID